MAAAQMPGIDPIRAHELSVTDPAADFMSKGYSLIREPLNLESGGQAWFTNVFDRAMTDGSRGMVLGAITWMIRMLQERRYRDILVIDRSLPMLRSTEAGLSAKPDKNSPAVEFHQGDWLSLPQEAKELDIVMGDNSFSFLRFPDDWSSLCSQIAQRMRPNGKLMMRCLSVPKRHKALSVEQIVDRFMHRPAINYTEVRATLLFSHWSDQTYAIDTERALATFDSAAAAFEPLFRLFPPKQDNDLVTIAKYRNAGAVYYAPPLPDLLDVIEQSFRVQAVHFGPYSMREYFPLIEASR